MTNTKAHAHDFSNVVRLRGKKVRRQCACLKLDGWKNATQDELAKLHVKPVKVTIVQPKPLGVVNSTPADDYDDHTAADLRGMCKDRGLHGYSGLTKAQLIDLLQADDRDSAHA
jgi:hypothetical protein